MKKIYFIIVSADTPHGPVKGAYALANSLAENGRNVTLVMVKKGAGANAHLNNSVKKIYLADHVSGYFNKLSFYQKILVEVGNRNNIVSISMCFSADAINIHCRQFAKICSSIRGNLIQNYRLDYGILGFLLAFIHLLMLRFFDFVVVMTNSMAFQVKGYIGKPPNIIGNFVDEKQLDFINKTFTITSSKYYFVFVGTLSKRKRPALLLDAIKILHGFGLDFHLHIVGDGPLRPYIESRIIKDNLSNNVTLHGFTKNPYKIISSSDVMVLPSLSEGASRAVMEALYLGVPCVVANIDGNSELIEEGVNGALFSEIADLPGAILRALEISRNLGPIRPILLSKKNRQISAVSSFINLLESV